MTSARPYLLRAIYSWLVDNGLTPHLLADASVAGVVVPMQYVENNRILLNISPAASHGITLGDDMVTFSARFGGSPFQVQVPVNAVLAVYARENGQGMVFQDEEPGHDSPPSASATAAKRPVLTVVK